MNPIVLLVAGVGLLVFVDQAKGRRRNPERGSKTPGYNTRISIRFGSDRRGRPVAHYWGSRAERWLPIGYDKAKILVASGEADEHR